MKRLFIVVTIVLFIATTLFAGGTLTRYEELKASGNITLTKDAEPTGQEEQVYTLTQKRYDTQTGAELAPLTNRHSREGLLRSRAGLQAQLDAIDAILDDIDKLNVVPK